MSEAKRTPTINMTPDERLLYLAAALRKNAKNKRGMKFDLSNWITKSGPKGPRVSCGTVGCAFGLATMLPAFIDQGLYLKVYLPRYRGGRDGCGWGALEDFFDLSQNEATYLFCVESYRYQTGARAELAVAKRLEVFAAKRNKASAKAEGRTS